MLASRSSFREIRGLNMHVRTWGNPGAPRLVLLHGWMDCSASFQFIVDELDALGHQWQCVAPDLRGFGLSEWARDGIYSYTDYLADLDQWFTTLDDSAPVHLLGHSLGGNIASLFAAVRPQRVRSLINLEGFGLRSRAPREAPEHLRNWLDDLTRFEQRRAFDDFDTVVRRVRQLSSRIEPARARYVAEHWSEPDQLGQHRLRADPAHLRAGPDLWRLDEAMACWRSIVAPVLWVQASQSENLARHQLNESRLARRRAALAQHEMQRIDDAGHMLHWEHPGTLARLIAGFLARNGG